MNIQDTNRRIRLIMELRNKGITDMSVLGAMERVPRDVFVPEAVRDQAWDDTALPIGLGQTISQPWVVAKMTQSLGMNDRDQVLEIGTGCGYQTAVLAHLARRIYTVERHKPLAALAQERFDELRLRNVTALCGDGMRGWPHKLAGDTPQFTKIIVTAAARHSPPPPLLDQLAEGGSMIIPIGQPGDQHLRLYKKSGDDYSIQTLMPVRFVPLLPDIA